MSQHKFYRFQLYSTEFQVSHNQTPTVNIQALTTSSQPCSINPQICNNTNNYPVDHRLNEPTFEQNVVVIPIPPWRPSSRLRNLHTRFQNTIFFQHICLPCVFCARLLYPAKAEWIDYDPNYNYPLEHIFQTFIFMLKETNYLPKFQYVTVAKNLTEDDFLVLNFIQFLRKLTLFH
jgi:hypothetical protein